MEHIERIFNSQTGETTEIVRDFTKEELAYIAQREAKLAAEKLELEKKALARQAILDRLGLTEEEARLLLG